MEMRIFFLTAALALAFAPDGPWVAEALADGERHLAFFHGGGGSGKKGVLKKKEKSRAETALQNLEGEARLVLFTEKKGCGSCGKAERLMDELASLSPKVSLEVLSLSDDAGRAGELGIDRVPGTALEGSGDTGIRYYGRPLGYELEVFVDAIRQAAEGEPDLAPETMAGLGRLKKPVTITIFVAET